MKEQGGIFLKVLDLMGRLIPGDYLKTTLYLYGILRPRKILRKSIGGFYRMDLIYEVLMEFNTYYAGKFSVLEFGVADGYSFTKQLYATRYLQLEERVIVHGFDTFAGLPNRTSAADEALIGGAEWVAGQYRGDYDRLLEYCRQRYTNFELHKGLFEDTLTDHVLESLTEYLPILIWVDCDYYASTKTIFERLIPYIPTGCVVYFDDIYYNFSSRFTGEMKAVWEINQGQFGAGVELVPDLNLTWDSNRVYRFINTNAKTTHQLVNRVTSDPVRQRRGASPFP